MSFLGKSVNKILMKIKKGNVESKNVLLKNTYNHLKKLACNYVRNKDDLEDVLSVSYDKVFQRLDTFDFKKDGYNWMCKIMQHTAYDFNKKYTREIPFEEVIEPTHPEDFEEKILLKDQIDRLLQTYSERDQNLMHLRFWENRTIEEIAEELDMGKSNVHKRLHIILSEMFEKLENKVEK